ncbi:MAG: TldD/PmbA family protein [Candidatus Hydrothermarchaeales archaeon]
MEPESWDGEIEKILEIPARFVDVTLQSSKTTSILSKDGVAKDISTGELSGICIRVLDKGWGFASSNDLKDIYALATRAYKIAKRVKREIKFEVVDAVEDRVKVKPRIDPASVGIEEKREILSSAEDAIADLDGIVSSSFSYFDSNTRISYLNSEGSRIEAEYPRVAVFSSVFAKKGAKLQIGLERLGATAGLEALEKVGDSSRKAGEKALSLLDAKEAPRGNFQVVLDSKLTGVFIHEALGHAVEADHVIQGESILEDKLGKAIASELVTVFDDPTIDGSFGFYFYDSEGTRAMKKVVVKNGVLKSYLHSRETSSEMGHINTGNARSQSYAYQPLVRMSNTYLEPGDFEFEEIVDVAKGVYLKGSKGGEVDTVRGVFQFSAEEGFLIENGEITTPVRDVALSGRTLDILKNVDAVGKDFGIHIGFCGKGAQSVPVGDGGPHMRTFATVGGTVH